MTDISFLFFYQMSFPYVSSYISYNTVTEPSPIGRMNPYGINLADYSYEYSLRQHKDQENAYKLYMKYKQISRDDNVLASPVLNSNMKMMVNNPFRCNPWK